MKNIALAFIGLALVSGCMKTPSASKVKEFTTSGGRSLTASELPSSIQSFLKSPRDVERSATSVQVALFGGGSCPRNFLNQSEADGYTCTYGTAAYRRSGEKFSDIEAEHTGWGYSAPKGFRSESTASAVYAILAKYLGYDSLNESEKSSTKFDYSISESDVSGSLAGKSRSGKAYVITVKSAEKATGMEQTMMAVLESDGRVWGTQTVSAENWNGTLVANGPTSEIQFHYDASSSAAQPATSSDDSVYGLQ